MRPWIFEKAVRDHALSPIQNLDRLHSFPPSACDLTNASVVLC